VKPADKILGIDLGTTYSVPAIIKDGVPVLIPVRGERLLPSVVGISPEGEVLVGYPARNQWIYAPERTIRSIKRKMGKGEQVVMAGRSFSPQEISAFILREIKQAAEEALGYPVTRAVITVPAYFNEVQRQATIEAGEIAGLVVERIINEPTASALAYGYGLNSDQNLRVLVYDLGGGTFDVSIIELNQGVVDVLATAGDNYLGGDDFDERLATVIADEFRDAHDIDLRQDHQAWARLLRAAEEAKIELSSAPYATVKLEYVAKDKRGKPLHINREVTRWEFEELISDLLERTIKCVNDALADAHLQPKDIDRVLLVGGSTRIPAVWELMARHMGQDPHGEIDPDAAVALGAAVQAGIIAGEEIDTILVDVTPLSLGIETVRIGYTGYMQKDVFSPLIRRNTTIPVQKSQVFSTVYPGQSQILVRVYQGESQIASQNVLLGEFMVENLKPNRPDGLTDVTINFALDVNGILDVTVLERKTGKQVTERLKASRQRLSPEEIARSQAKLAETYTLGQLAEKAGTEEAEVAAVLDPGVSALLERARRMLERRELDPAIAAEMAGIVNDIQHASADGDVEQVEELCDRLIDLLMEAGE
jgi:molecular chaperone DnaK